jgi:hypothetical protein
MVFRIDRAVLGCGGQGQGVGRLVVRDLGPRQGRLEPRQRDLARGARQADQPAALAEEARRAGLVGADVGVLVGQHRLVRGGQQGQGEGVGGRARGGEPDLGVGVQQGADAVAGGLADVVGPIARGRPGIGGDQGLHDLGHGAGDVVGREIVAGHESSVREVSERLIRCHGGGGPSRVPLPLDGGGAGVGVMRRRMFGAAANSAVTPIPDPSPSRGKGARSTGRAPRPARPRRTAPAPPSPRSGRRAASRSSG